MILPISIIGTTVLRKKAVEIEENYENLDKLIADLYETMYSSDGVGLAAPQAGFSIRLMVIDATEMAEDEPELKDFNKVFINAKIIERTGDELPMEEGCLSIPGVREDVKRPDKIRIQYYDENFKFYDEYISGWGARIVQHEYDHLEGILFTDRISPIKKRLLKGKLEALSKGKFDVKYKVRLATKKRV